MKLSYPAAPPPCPAGLAFGTALLLTFLPLASPAQEVSSWSTRGPSARIYGAQEVWVMPAGAAQAAQRRLPTPPREWWRSVDPRRHLVRLAARGVEVNFLVTRRSWCLLTDQSIGCLNQIMLHKARDLGGCGLDDAEKLSEYLDALDDLTVNPRAILDDTFVRSELDPVTRHLWLDGRENRLSELMRLCGPPALTRRGEEVTITYNEMLMDGSVVRRTVHARAVRQLELSRLETVEIRPAGTFSYDPIFK